MVTAPTKLPPGLLEEVKQLAEARQWKPSHAIRFLVTKGLESLKAEQPAERDQLATV